MHGWTRSHYLIERNKLNKKRQRERKTKRRKERSSESKKKV
jgi:hypothetical protein